MVVPNFFVNTAEQRIASYEFTDIASGVGFTSFFGAVSTSGSNLYILTPNQIYSDRAMLISGGTTGITLSTAGFQLIQEYNFDSSKFNLPRTMKGTVSATIPWGSRGQAGATSTDTVKHVVKVIRWDGVVETIIGIAESNPVAYGPVDQQIKTYIDNISVECPQHHFKKSNQIRINVEQYAKSALAAKEQTHKED